MFLNSKGMVVLPHRNWYSSVAWNWGRDLLIQESLRNVHFSTTSWILLKLKA